jgi:hypothetical protein
MTIIVPIIENRKLRFEVQDASCSLCSLNISHEKTSYCKLERYSKYQENERRKKRMEKK